MICLLLLAEPCSVLLVVLRAVGLVEGTDDEVCDKGICAVFLDVKCRVGCCIHVCHYRKETPACQAREKAEKKDFSSCLYRRNSLDSTAQASYALHR